MIRFFASLRMTRRETLRMTLMGSTQSDSLCVILREVRPKDLGKGEKDSPFGDYNVSQATHLMKLRFAQNDSNQLGMKLASSVIQGKGALRTSKKSLHIIGLCLRKRMTIYLRRDAACLTGHQ